MVTLDPVLINPENQTGTDIPVLVITIQPKSSCIFNVSDLIVGTNFTGSMISSTEVLG